MSQVYNPLTRGYLEYMASERKQERKRRRPTVVLFRRQEFNGEFYFEPYLTVLTGGVDFDLKREQFKQKDVKLAKDVAEWIGEDSIDVRYLSYAV